MLLDVWYSIYLHVIGRVAWIVLHAMCLCGAVAFNMYDLDCDDKISRSELLSVLHMMVGANISEEQVSRASLAHTSIA